MADEPDEDTPTSITSEMVSSGSGFDPAEVESKEELRSGSKLSIFQLYQRLLEKGEDAAAAKLSEEAGSYRLGETAARLSRKHLTHGEAEELGLPLRWR